MRFRRHLVLVYEVQILMLALIACLDSELSCAILSRNVSLTLPYICFLPHFLVGVRPGDVHAVELGGKE
jgi:hypothetical protein